MKDQKSIDVLLGQFSAQSLVFNRGIERETLRVDATGNLAKSPHPDFLGSKLYHPTITTDFSEAQLELITPVSDSIDETLNTLRDTHRYVNSGLQDEILWAASMPCVLQDDDEIPLARYGDSNLGKLKTTYRHGLGARYGRSMQTICAVHYNVSFNDRLWQQLADMEKQTNDKSYRTRRYFDAMRNFRRFSWLPIILTGASPAVCNSFVKDRPHELEAFDTGSLHKPYATSLRNGNLGYQSDAQSNVINICYNNLENYVGTLASAVCQPYPEYTRLNSNTDGEHNQLNDSILQSEAEFYTTIRAKCVPTSNKNFLRALLEDGVEYIEIRLLDADPYEPLGIGAETIRFLDTLLLYCLLIDSPDHDPSLCASVKTNVSSVVINGRNTDTLLDDNGQPRSIADWSKELLADLSNVALYLDGETDAGSDGLHQKSIALQKSKIDNPDLTPSGKILNQMRDEAIPFFRLAMNQSLKHKQAFSEDRLTEAEMKHFEAMAAESRAKQTKHDATPQDDFERYLGALQKQYQQLVNQLY